MAGDPFPQQRRPECPVLQVWLFGRRKVGSVQPFHLYTLTLKTQGPSNRATQTEARAHASQRGLRRAVAAIAGERKQMKCCQFLSFFFLMFLQDSLWKNLAHPHLSRPESLAPPAAAPSLCAHCFKHQSAPPRCLGRFRARAPRRAPRPQEAALTRQEQLGLLALQTTLEKEDFLHLLKMTFI